VQAVSWGHPETSGLPTIDYFLSGEQLEAANAQDYYTEQLVALPHLGCYCEPMQVAPTTQSFTVQWRVAPGTPVFICPGVPYKYAPEHDRMLTEIGRRLGDCRFIFFTHRLRKISDKLRQRLHRSFLNAGLDPARFVVFLPWQTVPDFHACLRSATVYLDTIGFSGFNTAMQAAQCNIPIVTREGRFMRGRLASGILCRMNIPELIALSEDHYIDLAVRLAGDAAFRDRMRSRIAESAAVLYRDEMPIRALETFLEKAVSCAAHSANDGLGTRKLS
jgi:predicted O-linked N-acetylglucosamine transferase (SPINDLY family)